MPPIVPYLTTALSNLFKKPVTDPLPTKAAPQAPAGYRGRILFDPTKCINCGMCERVCAPHCMTRESKPLAGGEPGDLEITFTFDMTSCTFCGLCADFCSRNSIQLTQDCIITGTSREDFLVVGSFVKKAPPKPKFTPEQLAAMKAAAEAKKKAAAQAAAKAEG